MKLLIRDQELRVVMPNRARNRDIIRLQEQSGLKLSDFAGIGERSDLHAVLILSFLAQANAGMEPDYQQMMDGGRDEVGEIVREPSDDLPETSAQEAAAVDPQPAAPGTSGPAAAEAPVAPAPATA